MGIERVRDYNSISNDNYLKKNEPEPEPPPPPVVEEKAETRIEENRFEGSFQKEKLFARFDQVQAVAQPNQPAANPDVNKQADEIINRNTTDGILGKTTDTEKVGREIAEIANTNPGKGAEIADAVIKKSAWGDRDDVSKAFVNALSPEQLREFAKNEKGKQTLETARQNMDGGIKTDEERVAITRIDNAKKAADFQNTPEYKKLPPQTQKEVTRRLDENQGNSKATDNLIHIAKSGGFAYVSPRVQQRLLEAYDKHKDDKTFADALAKLGDKVGFRVLDRDEKDQIKVIEDLEKFAASRNYKENAGYPTRPNREDEKAFLLNGIGDMSILSGLNPDKPALRNTLDKVLSDKVRISTYSQDPEKEDHTRGRYEHSNVISINMHPKANDPLTQGLYSFSEVIVHETNHQLNGKGKKGTADMFLDEYRSYYVGQDSVSQVPMDAERQKKLINNLITNDEKIVELYKKDENFRKFIDSVKAGLDKKPPELLDPEQMRQKLQKSGFDSSYIRKAGNTDNH